MAEPRRTYVAPPGRLVARYWLGTVIGTLAVTTLLCGIAGFGRQYADAQRMQAASLPRERDAAAAPPALDWTIPIYKTVQLFLLNSGTEDDEEHPNNLWLAIARMSAAALFLVVSSAVILRVVDEVRSLPRQLAQYDHVVICGLGGIGLQLLDDLGRRGNRRRITVIEIDPANSWLDYARSKGAAVIVGDCTIADTLQQARAVQAREVFVVTGDDGDNVEVAAELAEIHRKQAVEASVIRPAATRVIRWLKKSRGGPLQVYVHIADTNLAAALQPYHAVMHGRDAMRVHLFNIPRATAVRLVTEQLWPFAPRQADEIAHFVMVGFGAMGQALAVQLAQLGHFPNRKRSRFTIADQNVEVEARAFLSRFPRFTSWISRDGRLGVEEFSPQSDEWDWNEHPLPQDLRVSHPDAIQYLCNAEFVDLPGCRADELFARRLVTQLDAPGVKPVVFVCGQRDRENFDRAVQLRDTLADLGRPDIPIFVWLPRQPALAEILARKTEDAASDSAPLRPFGELRSVATYHEIVNPMRELIGEKIHEDYQRLAVARGEQAEPVRWSDARDGFRESSRIAADHLLIKLSALGLRLRRQSEPGPEGKQFDSIKQSQLQLLGKMEHYRFVAERLLSGWRFDAETASVDGREASKRRRLNSTLVPWNRLGSDRKKDFDQVKTVLRECQRGGFAVVPWNESNPHGPAVGLAAMPAASRALNDEGLS